MSGIIIAAAVVGITGILSVSSLVLQEISLRLRLIRRKLIYVQNFRAITVADAVMQDVTDLQRQ